MVSSIPGLYSFNLPPSCDRQKCPSILPMPPESSENHCYGVHNNLFILGFKVNILALQNLPFPGPQKWLKFLPVKRDPEDMEFWSS